MKFLQVINKRKFVLINLFLFLYILLNLLDGERGLISYYKKNIQKENLLIEKKLLSRNLSNIEHKIDLLSRKLDLDYLEILYRKKFMVGKKEEIIYNIFD